jgi:hypothetical protein
MTTRKTGIHKPKPLSYYVKRTIKRALPKRRSGKRKVTLS